MLLKNIVKLTMMIEWRSIILVCNKSSTLIGDMTRLSMRGTKPPQTHNNWKQTFQCLPACWKVEWIMNRRATQSAKAYCSYKTAFARTRTHPSSASIVHHIIIHRPISSSSSDIIIHHHHIISYHTLSIYLSIYTTIPYLSTLHFNPF